MYIEIREGMNEWKKFAAYKAKVHNKIESLYFYS